MTNQDLQPSIDITLSASMLLLLTVKEIVNSTAVNGANAEKKSVNNEKRQKNGDNEKKFVNRNR